MNLRSITAAVCLTTGTVLSFSISADAITYTLSAGRTRPTTPTVTNEGSFSNFDNLTTIDFNTGTVSGGNYTTAANNNTAAARYSGITTPSAIATSTQYAPPGPGYVGTTGTNNTSRYLSVQGGTGVSTITPKTVTINFGTSTNPNSLSLRYFGLNWGFQDESNVIEFFNVNVTSGIATSVGRFNGTQVFGTNPTQSSAYVDFFASGTETFNRVVLSESTTNGFETDNHQYSTTAVPWRPSPILNLLGLGALSAVIALKRKLKNNPKLLSWLSLKSKLSQVE